MSARLIRQAIPLALNPCASVRTSCANVCLQSRYVTIHDSVVNTLAQDIVSNYAAYSKTIEWNTDWHFHDKGDMALTTQYLFVLDSLNFCFWPSPGFEYEHLAVGIKSAVLRDKLCLTAERLATMDADTLRSWFAPLVLPNADERVLRLRELGEALRESYDGEAFYLVQACNRSAVQLTRLVLQLLPGFRDTSVLDGKLVHFYKRAQILCGDLWAAFGKSTDPVSCFSFNDLDELTMFADYRVPQLLLHLGVLTYSDELFAKIKNLEEIDFGSRMEVEIRAATVIAVEQLKQALAASGSKYLSIELDWILWNIGETSLGAMHPHHRSLTIYY